MSDTPRTDAAELTGWISTDHAVSVAFSRQLERELSIVINQRQTHSDKIVRLERELAESQLEQIRERNRYESAISMCGEQACKVIADHEAEKKSHDETTKELESCTQELRSCADHITKLNACLERGLAEYDAAVRERGEWRACAEHLKDAVCTALNCGEQQGFEREFCKEALAEFEKLKGTK